MFKVVAFFALLGCAVALPRQRVDWKQWQNFKSEFNKTYGSKAEEQVRAFVFMDNLKMVLEHNAMFEKGLTSYSMKINTFSDMLSSELAAKMNGLITGVTSENETEYFVKADNMQVADQVDWRTKGYVTEVKNQGQCGSCWTFSATGAMEGQLFKKTGKLVSLSEQNLIDCDRKDHGCDGGSMERAFSYVQKNGGIDTEDSYPYKARQGQCHYSAQSSAAKVKTFKRIPSGDEKALQQAVATVGPIAIGIDASKSSFSHYHQGVYNEPSCSSRNLDHGVLVVGYGTENGRDYWLVKNSWGPAWGDKGYIKMSRNKRNQCGVVTDASYPLE